MRTPNVLAMAIGAVLLAASAWQAATALRLLSGSARAEGVVLDDAAHPLIGFSAADGRRFTFVQNGFVSRPKGEAVPVVYRPEAPAESAMAATFWTIWGPALWLLVPGLGFSTLPLLGARFGWNVA